MTDIKASTPGGRAEPTGPAGTDHTFLYQPSAQSAVPGTWPADAAYPADSPIPYTLTTKAETLLGEAGRPTAPLRNTHACDMRPDVPHAPPGPAGQPRTYVTEICVPQSDNGIQRLHSRIKEPAPEPEAGL